MEQRPRVCDGSVKGRRPGTVINVSYARVIVYVLAVHHEIDRPTVRSGKGLMMKNGDRRALALIIAVLLLMTAGITTAAVLGSVPGIVMAVTIGTLVLSYAVRREARSTAVRHRGA